MTHSPRLKIVIALFVLIALTFIGLSTGKPAAPDRVGYTVHIVNPAGERLGEVQVPLHDLRRGAGLNRGRSEKSINDEYIVSIGNAVALWGSLNGKSADWVETNRAALHLAVPLYMAINPEKIMCLEEDAIQNYTPECGGTGARGGCGSIVCATTIRFHGQVMGCGNGCGDCSIVTTCP